MRKNGSRLISFKQYKFTDLLLFAVILVVFELILHFAYIAFGDNAFFTFSPMVPIVLLVMMRWGWISAFYAIGDGALYCLLNGMDWRGYLIYCVGNAFIMLVLIYNRFVGKEKIRQKLSLTLLYVFSGWLVTVLGRAAVAACVGINFAFAIMGQLTELISLVLALLLIVIMRRLDGMFEDQKHYLRRMDEERRELARRDEFGDEPIEIDEEMVSILRKRDDELQ